MAEKCTIIVQDYAGIKADLSAINEWRTLSIAVEQSVPTSLALTMDYIKDSEAAEI